MRDEYIKEIRSVKRRKEKATNFTIRVKPATSVPSTACHKPKLKCWFPSCKIEERAAPAHVWSMDIC
jgi:hypothetical protein